MRLDIGCGDKKEEGWTGLDSRDTDGVDIVHDIEVIPWPIVSESVEQVKANHILEHIERRTFFSLTKPCVMSEIWRVLKPEGMLQIAFPVAGSHAYYSDPTHVNPLSPLIFRHMDDTLEQWSIYKPDFKFHIAGVDYNAEEQEVKMIMVKRG